MENSSDKYLHKKFKKQLSVESRNHVQSKTVEIKEAETDNWTREVHDLDDYADNKDSVPNHSTNQNNLPVLNPYYASSYYRSSISEEPSDISKELNPQLTNNSISYMISKNRVASPNQSVNFDTRIHISEPTSKVGQSSSILENTNFKPIYVTSKLVNVKIDTFPSQEKDFPDPKTNETPSTPDKSSGGKHVCPYCNLACSKPSVLQKHIRAHTNERPYPCDSCGFSFKTRSNLYKHCRSRTHANRVMGNKVQEISSDMEADNKGDYSEQSPLSQPIEELNRNEMSDGAEISAQENKSKPYKPRFHTAKTFFDNVAKENVSYNEKKVDSKQNSDLLSHHINELINKNNSIVNSTDPYLLRKKSVDNTGIDSNDHKNADEPLNLTNKNRKRCLSEVMEPTAQKSLIKELLLKNLYADTNMQCPYCKMLFQTVTELELHKLRSCKGFTKSGARYSRSSSVNVASILTQNKNAFDNIPHLHNAVFPLKSPGPFLGKTSLVESDKNKSFSFDDVLPTFQNYPSSDLLKAKYALMEYDREKRPPVKLFGGEVKITHNSGETKSFKFDAKDGGRDNSYMDYGTKISENRVVKSSLQSGGTVLTNKSGYSAQDAARTSPDIIRVYDDKASPNIPNLDKNRFSYDSQGPREEADKTSTLKYTNIVDFSQKAVKLLAPNLKQLNLTIPGLQSPAKAAFPRSPLFIDTKPIEPHLDQEIDHKNRQILDSPSQQMPLCNPVNLFVNGKIVRYVPGMPGPVVAETSMDMASSSNIVSTNRAIPPGVRLHTPNLAFSHLEPIVHSPVKKGVISYTSSPTFEAKTPKTPEGKAFVHQKMIMDMEQHKSPKMDTLDVQSEKIERKSPQGKTMENSSEMKSPNHPSEPRKFARPNSLALKPSLSAVKQHHGLTPTMFNQVLISPDTPRVAKKYNQHMMAGNCFSYLGLKSSTKSVYCTLNKTQPVYVPHFKKLSMYSEWRQQDNKSDKLYVSAYDSRQRQGKFSLAGKTKADIVVHSSYKFVASEEPSQKTEEQKGNSILGGYECNEDYTYVRGRGRGRFVCDQCGIRCKKPSMLKKHLRTHSNVRPYACDHCNFRFKTKGNLTKHMKSKAHNKNYNANSGSNSSTQQSSTQSSESETEDSGMDSSDESTRQQEHEAAYGLLSLSQKTTSPLSGHQRNERASPTSYHRPQHITNHFSDGVMDTEEIVHVSKKNFAKNKFLDEQTNFSAKRLSDLSPDSEKKVQSCSDVLRVRPLTYPYTSPLTTISCPSSQFSDNCEDSYKIKSDSLRTGDHKPELKSIKHFQVIQNYKEHLSAFKTETPVLHTSHDKHRTHEIGSPKVIRKSPPIVKLNDNVINDNSEGATDLRKRKISVVENNYKPKIHRNENEVMDLSVRPTAKNGSRMEVENGRHFTNFRTHLVNEDKTKYIKVPFQNYANDEVKPSYRIQENLPNSEDNRIKLSYVIQEPSPPHPKDSLNIFKPTDYDNSAMETLADIATKQEKLEKNSVAKNVASEFLKLATKHEFPNDGGKDGGNFVSSNKDVNELIVKSEENKRCTICLKTFSKPSQLRLHMNIHYLERPFRCDSCSVSFRTKGHLQKHERSASHHNKLSSSPALSTSEPRPFKCSDCNIAFRIHGHLAKHLRSKMHIMRLECLAKIPFGLYAELERSNILLTEINTADGDQCLESLKTLAKKVFINDPSKLNQLIESSTEIDENSS